MASDWNSWQFEPGIVAGLSLLAVGYALAATRYRLPLLRIGGAPPGWLPPGALGPERPGRLTPWQAAAFFAGVLVAALSLLSPLHALGEHYLLSAHMVQHLLIALVVPPLLLLGTPGWMLRPLLRLGPVRRTARIVCAPIAGFLLFNAVFVMWHVPYFYELSLHFAPAHALEHAAFVSLALLAWWPVFGPLPELPRLPHGAQVVYLFFSSLPPTVLGAVIALAVRPLYPTYWSAPRVFGLSPAADQQLAGLIMWIPGALVYLAVLTVVFFLWIDVRGPAESAPYGTVNPDRARLTATKTNAGGTLRHT